MEVKVVGTCPLGSKCEEAVAGELRRCHWFIEMQGKDPSTGDPIAKKGCAMAWLPVLLVENSRQQYSTGAAIESFRNAVMSGQQAAIEGAMKQDKLLK